MIDSLLALALTSGMQVPELEPRTVIMLNVHGSVDRYGGGNAGSPTAINADVLALVDKYEPDAIGLQELCLRQHRSLKTKLAALGYVATMTYTRTTSGCNDAASGNKFGNALYLKAAGFAWRTSAALPWGANAVGTTGREARRIVCARGTGWTWKACSTHVSPYDPDRAAQVAKVRTLTDGWANSMTIIVAGDWNASLGRVVTWMPGRYVAGSGIDHAVSTSPVVFVAADAVPSSDHRAVVVSATIR